MEQCKGKRITGKVKTRLQGLAFLAVQVAAGEIKGWEHTQYSDTKLAERLGVAKQTFNDVYKDYWHSLLNEMNKLDIESLRSASTNRIDSRLKNNHNLQTRTFSL